MGCHKGCISTRRSYTDQHCRCLLIDKSQVEFFSLGHTAPGPPAAATPIAASPYGTAPAAGDHGASMGSVDAAGRLPAPACLPTHPAAPDIPCRGPAC